MNMNEKQYLNALKRELRGLNGEDRLSIVDDCREHFKRARSSGQSDNDTARALGPPEDVAEEARNELGLERFRETRTGNAVRVSFAGVSVLLFNAIVVVGPYAGLVGVLAGLWATALSLAVAGVGMVLSVPAEPLLRMWIPMETVAGILPRIAVLFGGLAVASLGSLFIIGMIYTTRWFVRVTLGYAKMTWRIISL